ncbi:DNA-3-methyladenine glycosylase 2 family protein [Catenulispora sp. NF23]|uniref:DNA-3-methyladenine glycosylase 2 family protein n=1 Tax=Catenulispora pinistramenti TaxID=2705254 RepID=A0ABS5L3M4_9ACTN|nr:DNA-3-methyladenine glycosylase 2 family protein [Catenulispora pinistramenti]MBS2539094.1 DNA-3-methyladenine glycosylase 2 family protein [Catenulispora pinistramenti]MBS2552827.1 DNA-3-methyladenine glycosylase 2 family protein [Catenulispora pinistramenti]
MEQPPDHSVHWQPAFPVDARLTLGSLRHGQRDPTHRVEPDGTIWRTARTATGLVTYRIRQQRLDDLLIDAWGPGAAELADGVRDELGARDRPEQFHPEQPLLRRAQRRLVGLRVPGTGRLFEAIVPAIIEQRVVGVDAFAGWTRLVKSIGEPAPGPTPAGMRVPPSPEAWAQVPSWDWRQAGIDLQRSRTIVQTARHAERLDQTAGDPHAAYRLMAALPGIGTWTAAQVGHRALGDADALPLGDYHLGRTTGIALLGRPLADDEVEAFYEQWRPHRYRVIRLLELTPGAAPRRAPRAPRNRPLR